MSEQYWLKWLGIGAAYITILVGLIVRGIVVIKKRTNLEGRIEQMETDLIDMDVRHGKDILRIETSLETVRTENNKQHSGLDNKIEDVKLTINKVAFSMSEISGFLRAQSIKK